jgi:hypothetical protein
MSDARRDSGFGIRDSGETPRPGLDAVIGAVAREMTEAEPSGALRARVLDEIATGRREIYAVRRWAWAGAAAVLLVAVATFVWLVRRAPLPGEAPATITQQRTEVLTELAPGKGALSPTTDVTLASPAASSPASSTPLVRLAAARPPVAGGTESARDSHDLAPLAEIEPLRFDAVEPDPLQIDSVEMTPFPTIEPIDIPSLDPGPHDLQSTDPKKEK